MGLSVSPLALSAPIEDYEPDLLFAKLMTRAENLATIWETEAAEQQTPLAIIRRHASSDG